MKRLGLLLLLGACTVPYQPLQATVEVMPPDAYQRTLEVVRARYPKLEVADDVGFRIQSRWVPHDDRRAGEKRATVFLDAKERVNVVVETRYLGLDLWGKPSWTSARGDPALERELMQAVLGVLERD